MKKSLFFLPLIAGMALCSCEFEIFGIHIGGDKTKNDESTDTSIVYEYQGYKLAKEVKDGGKYILGVYRINEDKMRFANGDYHRDDNGEYPYYMGTVEGTTGAAEITVKMLGHGEFSMQVSAPGMVWDQKYIGVYAANSSFNNPVMSIALLDSPDQTSYSQGGKTYTPKGRFKYFEEYDGVKQYAPGVMFQYQGIDEEEVPKFLGTGHNANAEQEGDYTSFDCKSYEVALSRDAYDLAHLYEKK